MIEISFDKDAAVQRLKRLERDIYEKAMARALNRTAASVRAEAARRIKREIGSKYKIGELKKSIAVIRANTTTLVAIVRPSGRKRIPLAAFNPRQTASGVTVRLGNRTVSIPHAFIRRPRGWDREAVRIRAPAWKAQLVQDVQFRPRRSGEYRGKPDYPIAEVMAPGVPILFVQANVMAALKAHARERFATIIAQELRFRGL